MTKARERHWSPLEIEVENLRTKLAETEGALAYARLVSPCKCRLGQNVC